MNKSGSFNINGVRIHVEDDDFVEPWRDHETVLMQHGFCRNAEFWSTWVPYFGRNYRIVRPHLRGHGFSSDPGPTYKLTLDDLIADLIGVLDTLKIDSVHYIGESFGSVIGVSAAARHPDRFKSLTLQHTPTTIGGEAGRAQAIGRTSWQDAMRELGLEKWWLQARAATGDLTGDPRADEYTAREAARTPLHIAIGVADAARNFDLSDSLRKLRAPTQFHTSGRYSYTTTAEQQRNLLELVPHAELVVHEEATGRTFFPFFDVDLVAPRVLEFVRRVDAAKGQAS